MTVRQFHVSLWPHEKNTTVTVVIEDVTGARRVSGGVCRITLPVGRNEFAGQPVGVVLTTLGEALRALGSTLSPKGSPAPLEGPQGGLSGREEFDLDLR